MRITDRIFEIAQKLGIKNSELATLFGASKQSMYDYKTGRANIPERNIFKFLIHFTEVDANYIIRGNIEGVPKVYKTNEGLLKTEDSELRETEVIYMKQIIEEKNKQIDLLNRIIENQ